MKEWLDWSPFHFPFNFTGHPAASVPCGFTSAGLPIGLQVVGARYADALELVREPVTKLLARHPSAPFADVLAAARRIGGDDAVSTTAGGTVVEISGAGVTKASALATLCAAEGIVRAAVIAFGDAPNDLALLAFAGRSVAVGNAHPDVLAAAGEVTASNDDDGVAQVLERLLDGIAAPT